MTENRQLHPGDSQLLTYLDGELEAREAAEVGRHLAVCAACRELAEELREGLSACVRLHQFEWKPLQPVPPHPWPSLAGRFDELDAVAEPRKRTLAFSWGWAAAAAAVVAAVAIYRFAGPETVSAAELLEKAVAVQTAAPSRARIEVRTSSHRFTRPADLSAASRTRLEGTATSTAAYAEVEALFRAANFDWSNPLSARSFAEWRNTLADKSDVVRVLSNKAPESERLYRIETSTRHGILAMAALTLRANDLRPLQERFEFRNREWVEISELPPHGPEMLPQESSPARTETRVPSGGEFHRVGPAEELRVLAALHRLGADLGEPIEVTRDSNLGKVIVRGIGLSATRWEQIQAALANFRYVEFRFEQPQPVRAGDSEALPGSHTAPAAETSLQRRLEERLGGRAFLDQLVNRVLDATEGSLARAHALHDLAERFPPEIEGGLDRKDRLVLDSLWRRHASALAAHLKELEAALDPVLDDHQPLSPAACRRWQECAGPLLQAAQELDGILTRSLAGTGSATGETSSRVRAAFAKWEATVAAYPVAREILANK
jgi:predicted anti-sigma-YlaC factor YlaD